MVAALNAVRKIKHEEKIIFPETTMIGALSKYISSKKDEFQPMNANFGIMPELNQKIKDKKVRYQLLADRAIENMEEMLKNNQ